MHVQKFSSAFFFLVAGVFKLILRVTKSQDTAVKFYSYVYFGELKQSHLLNVIFLGTSFDSLN